MTKVKPRRTSRELVAREIALSLAKGIDYKTHLFITKQLANAVKWRPAEFRDFCKEREPEYPGNGLWWAPTIPRKTMLRFTDDLQRLLPIRFSLEHLLQRGEDD